MVLDKNEVVKMSLLSSDVIDLVEKDGVFGADVAVLKKQELTNNKASVKKVSKIEYLTKSQINALLAGVSDARDKLFLNLLWKTGIRISEAISIQKKHLNIEHGRITIRWLKNRRATEREVTAPRDLIEQLVIYARTLKYDELLFGFSRQWGERITKKWMGISPHKLRHSFAMNWLDQRLPVEVLQMQMGHKNISTTMKYVHLSQSRARECMDEVDWS